MKIEEFLQKFDTILENGPLGTRLKYDYGFEIFFDLTEREEGTKALIELYEGDIKIAYEYNLPIILNANTFRANKHHLQSAGFKTDHDFKNINTNCVNLVKKIQAKYSAANIPILIGAPLGSMYDSYNTNIIPSTEEAQDYHKEQINIFKELEVDFVNAVTLPSLAEATGISLAAEHADVNYAIGFVLNKEGMVLDGTPLERAIDTIDTKTKQKPFGYLITCTHASIIENLIHSPRKYNRLIGIQPNGSSLPFTELNTMKNPIADSPEKFAQDLMHLKTKLGLKIIGGCCGTTRMHLQHIAQLCAQS